MSYQGSDRGYQTPSSRITSHRGRGRGASRPTRASFQLRGPGQRHNPPQNRLQADSKDSKTRYGKFYNLSKSFNARTKSAGVKKTSAESLMETIEKRIKARLGDHAYTIAHYQGGEIWESEIEHEKQLMRDESTNAADSNTMEVDEKPPAEPERCGITRDSTFMDLQDESLRMEKNEEYAYCRGATIHKLRKLQPEPSIYNAFGQIKPGENMLKTQEEVQEEVQEPVSNMRLSDNHEPEGYNVLPCDSVEKPSSIFQAAQAHDQQGLWPVAMSSKRSRQGQDSDLIELDIDLHHRENLVAPEAPGVFTFTQAIDATSVKDCLLIVIRAIRESKLEALHTNLRPPVQQSYCSAAKHLLITDDIRWVQLDIIESRIDRNIKSILQNLQAERPPLEADQTALCKHAKALDKLETQMTGNEVAYTRYEVELDGSLTERRRIEVKLEAARMLLSLRKKFQSLARSVAQNRDDFIQAYQQTRIGFITNHDNTGQNDETFTTLETFCSNLGSLVQDALRTNLKFAIDDFKMFTQAMKAMRSEEGLSQRMARFKLSIELIEGRIAPSTMGRIVQRFQTLQASLIASRGHKIPVEYLDKWNLLQLRLCVLLGLSSNHSYSRPQIFEDLSQPTNALAHSDFEEGEEPSSQQPQGRMAVHKPLSATNFTL